MAKGSGESKLALVGAVTLALAFAGALLVKEPLQSSRPVGTGLEMKQITGEQLVRARLWEDPLEAVHRGLKEKSGAATVRASSSPQSLLDRVRPIRQAIDGRVRDQQQITVLLVTTAGGPQVESMESRIRDRYALGSALGVACYVPEDEGNLSFLEWEPNGGAPALPYEWYRERKTRVCDTQGERADNVLVIWLPDEALRRGFLATLTSLSQVLVCQESSRNSDCLRTDDRRQLVHLDPKLQQKVTFKVVGPRSSSAFRELLQEAAVSYAEPREGIGVWPNKDGKIDLYSPWATAMKGLLAYGLKDDQHKRDACLTYEQCEQAFHQTLANAGIRLAYDIGSDDELFEELLNELERRQVRLGWDAVILIGEWDSFYGRALPIEFRAAACARISKRSPQELKTIQVSEAVQSWCRTVPQAIDLQIQHPTDYELLRLNVQRYSYLSGLDGEIPGDDKARAERAAKQKAGESSREARPEAAQFERPEGTSQLDYVRALAARIRDEGEGARAIGIMGTDPYDALLILKALRPQFPNAIFFTTDLDARYLHSSEYPWTRNMVIASHFGLHLTGGIQRDVPPFRDGYQTATFFATLRAVDHIECVGEEARKTGRSLCSQDYRVSLTPQGRVYSAALQPRLFEVGRNGAVDLSVSKAAVMNSIHPSRADLQHRVDAETEDKTELKTGRGPAPSVVVAMMGVGLLVVTLLVWTQQRFWQWACRNSRPLVAVTVAVVTAAAVAWVQDWPALLMANHDEGEPFSWTEGVSLWPTEIFRLLVVVLCVVFVAKASRDLAVNGDQLGEDYSFTWGKGQGAGIGLASFWTHLQRVCHPTPGAAMTADQAWSWYREAGLPLQRGLRVLIMFLFYAAVMMALRIGVFDEEFIRPCRGEFSCAVDGWLTGLSYILVVGLNLFVFDAVMLCRRWIGWLGQAANEWPEALQLKYVKDYGVAFEQSKGLACMDLIAQRTSVINRMIRYPFISLLILIVGRNNYFDHWGLPAMLVVAWTLNVLLALGGAYLLYHASDLAKQAVLSGLSRQLLQALGFGEEGDRRVRQVQHIIGEIESNQQGAFVPLYQQPVIESFLYGLVALLQYLYLR